MQEFIYQNSGFIIKCLEFLAAITGLVLYNKYKSTHTRYFIFFLIYVFFLEQIGSYTVYAHKYEFLATFKTYIQGNWLRVNSWLYTIFWVIGSTIFYSFYFAKISDNNKVNRILKLLTISFIFYALIMIYKNWDAFFVTTIKEIHIFSTIIITISICAYLIEVLKSDTILQFHKNINIYIAMAVLIWTIIIAPLSFFNQYYHTSDWGYIYLKTNIVLFSNVFLYLTFTFGLIFSKPEKK